VSTVARVSGVTDSAYVGIDEVIDEWDGRIWDCGGGISLFDGAAGIDLAE
jgi:hypothetical protein